MHDQPDRKLHFLQAPVSARLDVILSHSSKADSFGPFRVFHFGPHKVPKG